MPEPRGQGDEPIDDRARGLARRARRPEQHEPQRDRRQEGQVAGRISHPSGDLVRARGSQRSRLNPSAMIPLTNVAPCRSTTSRAISEGFRWAKA